MWDRWVGMMVRRSGWCGYVAIGLCACGPVLGDSDAGGDVTTENAPRTCSVESAAACASICDTLVGCFAVASTTEECVAGCQSRAASLSADCGALSCELLACRSPLGCGGVSDPDECSAEREAVVSQCSDEMCELHVGDDSCELHCSFGPRHDRTLQCEGARCICIENGTLGTECDVAGSLCADADQASMLELATSCCGW